MADHRWEVCAWWAAALAGLIAAVAWGPAGANAVVRQFSDRAMLDHLLTTPQAIPFIQGNHFVHRPEVDALVAELVLADGGVVVVEGPEGAGKSTAVAAAVANVSATIPTFSTKAWLRDTVDTLLRRMIGMPACGALFWFFWGETPVAELLWFRKRSPVQVSASS